MLMLLSVVTEMYFQDMKKSAILMPPFIGDFVLALSVVERKAAAAEGEQEITLLVPQHLIPLCTLLTALPYFPYRRSNRSEIMETIAGVKHLGFDSIYLLTSSFSAAWFAMRTGVAEKHALPGKKHLLRSIIGTRIDSKQSGITEHVTKEYADVLGISHQTPELWEGVKIRAPSEFSGNIVALCPGVGHDVSGRWQGFREIVKLLPSYEFVVLGSEGDKETAKNVASHLPHRVHNLAGKTSIEAAAAVLAGASVVVANHCGLMQLAGFLGAPVVGVFGATSPDRFRPLGQSVRCAVPESRCVNCNGRFCHFDNKRCLTSISPAQVIELAGEIVRQV